MQIRPVPRKQNLKMSPSRTVFTSEMTENLQCIEAATQHTKRRADPGVTCTEALVSALQSSATAKRNVCVPAVPATALHISRPAGDRDAPSGPDARVKRTGEPSGSQARSWYRKFSPWKDRRRNGGGCSTGASFSENNYAYHE